MIDKETKSQIISLVTALMPDAKIYLFGSRVRKIHAQWSDIDIALDTGKHIDHAALDEVKSVLQATNMPYKVDVVDFNGVSEQMRDSITKERIGWKS